MPTSAERRAAADKQVAENIRKYGCHVYSVSDPTQEQPSFSYSIGIQETTGVAEAIVFGLPSNLGHSMINEYLDQVRNGTRFESGVLYPGFLKGFEIYIEPTDASTLTDYTLGCTRFYGDKPYSVVQLIWPSTSGVWPWQQEASEWLRLNQPLFARRDGA